MDCAKVGQLIRTVRQEKNMTQNQLAELLRVTDKAISKWEQRVWDCRIFRFCRNCPLRWNWIWKSYWRAVCRRPGTREAI